MGRKPLEYFPKIPAAALGEPEHLGKTADFLNCVKQKRKIPMLRAYIRDFRIGGVAVLQEYFCHGRIMKK